jgi:kumamolisin
MNNWLSRRAYPAVRGRRPLPATLLVMWVAGTVGCSQGAKSSDPPEVAAPANIETITQALSQATPTPSSTGLALQVLTNSCGANQVQNFFQVTNNGSTTVPLSSIQIKLWADDTSGQKVVPQISYGGCVIAAGNPNCVHQVTGVAAAPATSFSLCGANGTQQANWEISISNTDDTMLAPGATWTNLQSQVHLANFGNFSPGTADWYSSCVSGSHGSYVNTGTFALYQAGQLVRTSTGVPPSCRAPSGSQTIVGNVPPDVASSPLLGSVPGTTELTLDIALQLQLNGAPGSGFPPIDTFIDQLSNPSSPNAPAPLTPAGFAAAYGPTATDYNNLINFVTAHGFTVDRTFTGRDMLIVSGTVADIESAFFVTLNVYQRPDGTTFYAPANDPSFNPGGSVASIPIIDVSGLDNVSQAFSGNGGTVSFTCGQSPIGFENAFYGSDFVNAYFSSCASELGQGQNQTVALFELDSYLANDITAFTQGTLLGEPPLNVPTNLTNVTQEVAPSSTPVPFGTVTFKPNGGNGTDNAEVALDMSMVLDVAPQANLIVYELNLNPKKHPSFNALLKQIADDDRAQVISSSWYWNFSTLSEQIAVRNTFKEFATQKQTFFEASMDKGAYIPSSPYNGAFSSPLPNVPEPHIDSPLMTVVGGTELTTTNSGGPPVYVSETTWNDTSAPRSITKTIKGVPTPVPQNSVTGGGFCTGTSPGTATMPLNALPIPSWQVGVNLSNTEVGNNPLNARMIPDVSLVATGIGIVLNRGSGCIGGTSAAAPLWAGFTALVNQANGVGSQSTRSPLGFLNPSLYNLAGQSTAFFNDIADGSNDDWFDDGQIFEGVSDAAGTPSPPTALPLASTTPIALPGAAPAGISEAAGLYHAVSGYDLATGLGTPTCNLLEALSPSLSPPPPVTITYDQDAACTLFADVLGPSGAFSSSGPGFAYVFFGIESIENTGTVPFTVQLGNLFVPPSLFASSIGSDLEESVYQPFAEPESQIVPAGGGISFSPLAIVGFAVLPTTASGTSVGASSLHYSLNPGDPSAKDPRVRLVKTNATTTSFPITGNCGDIHF